MLEKQKLKFIKPVELNQQRLLEKKRVSQNLGGRPIKCQGWEGGREME